VSPDDRRFLMVFRGNEGEEPTLVRVEHFLGGLKSGGA